MAKYRRERALDRSEMGQPTSPRTSAAGVTSLAVKIVDPATRSMIDDFLARRGA
jgi:hypothetical protein